MRFEQCSQVVVQGGPGDGSGDSGEEFVKQGVAVAAVVGEGDEGVADVGFGAVAGLAALQFDGTDGDGPGGGGLPEAKIKVPVIGVGVVEADEFVDRAMPAP